MPILVVMPDERSDLHDYLPERRRSTVLAFDPGSGMLTFGGCAVAVAPRSGNRAVLVAYVELASKGRGDQVADLVELRQDDLDALAQALDLEAEDLADQVAEVLGATGTQAASFVDRLRSSRVVGGAAKAAAGVVVAGSLLAGAAAATSASAPGPTAAEAAQVAAPIVDGPLTVDDQGVGLIPPVTEDAEGVVLIPPANVDAEDPPGS